MLMERTNVDLLITGGTVVTMDDANRIIADGAIAVHGRQIVAVGTADELNRAYTAGETIAAQGHAVMPGLIDTYGHAGHGMVKAIFHPRLGWPTNQLYFHATSAEWWHAEGMLSAVERLRFGVTCGLSVVGATPSRMDSPIFADRQADALREVGVRGVLAVGPPDPFVSHLPEPWSGTIWNGDAADRRAFTYEQTIANTVDIVERWHGQADGRVRIALHYPYLFGRQAEHPRYPFTYRDEHAPVVRAKAEEIRSLADHYTVLIHSHIFRGSVSYALKHFGREWVAHMLGSDVLLAHCNGLSAEEVAVLGEHNVGISVVPFTHENLMYGVCPAVELIRAGATVTISTDGSAPYASYDLFKDISRALWAQWERFGSERALPAGKGLRMVTIDAARALGLDDQIGSLEVGKRADLILIDLAQPHLTPAAYLPRTLAYFVNGHDVATVIVDGRVLMRDRRVLSVDEGAILAAARREIERAFKRFDITPYLELGPDVWEAGHVGVAP
jgi:cytosine/adenosine deaminase-related metal-dependent hydrolase